MRLYKRVAVGLLAAAMALSMMTACGGGAGGGDSGAGDAGTGGSGTGSSTGSGDTGTGGTGGSGTGSGSGSGSESGSSGTGGYEFDYDESTTGGTAAKLLENAVPVSNSSSKIVQNFAKSYTMEYSGDFGALKGQTGNFNADMMTTTDGNRTYTGGVGTMDAGGLNVTQKTATLIDKSANKEWVIDLNKGTYTVQKWQQDNQALDPNMMQKAKIYKGTYNGYDAEAFSVVQTVDGFTVTATIIYCFDGSGTPKSIVTREYAMYGLIDDEVMTMAIKKFERTARKEFLDFETILSNYEPA